MNNCFFCNNPPQENLIILKTNYWTVFLADDQAYLGRSFVALNRHCGQLSELTKSEWGDFQNVVKLLEPAVKKAFGPVVCNWSCLMNVAFQQKPFEPHIHWHFRPRYENPVNMFGLEFIDPEFGHHYELEKVRSMKVSIEVQAEIVKKIKENLP